MTCIYIYAQARIHSLAPLNSIHTHTPTFFPYLHAFRRTLSPAHTHPDTPLHPHTHTHTTHTYHHNICISLSLSFTPFLHTHALSHIYTFLNIVKSNSPITPTHTCLSHLHTTFTFTRTYTHSYTKTVQSIQFTTV